MNYADNSAQNSPLGRESAYPERYDPGLLFPIPRAPARAQLGIEASPPFIGHDRWQAYELSWLDPRGRPQVATASFLVPADSPRLVESKSLKLYLNSLNGERLQDAEAVRARIEADLSAAAGARVHLQFGLAPIDDAGDAACIDDSEVEIDGYGPPDASLLRAEGPVVEETLVSRSFKSNCPVTGQPDWASVHIAWHGPRLDRGQLLRYLAGFREHRGFHEQCVEQIFIDLQQRCAPKALSVEARFTRRGGLDINPWRATPGQAPPPPRRDLRQ
ncbi:NADPH-dependent 7-cyano-7-deazaguanine reductase QueF [Luteimonas sp. e5]